MRLLALLCFLAGELGARTGFGIHGLAGKEIPGRAYGGRLSYLFGEGKTPVEYSLGVQSGGHPADVESDTPESHLSENFQYTSWLARKLFMPGYLTGAWTSFFVWGYGTGLSSIALKSYRVDKPMGGKDSYTTGAGPEALFTLGGGIVGPWGIEMRAEAEAHLMIPMIATSQFTTLAYPNLSIIAGLRF